jgi:hypothetical protein
VTRTLLYGQGTALPLGEAPAARSTDRAITSENYQRRGVFDLLTVWSRQPGMSETTVSFGSGTFSGGSLVLMTDSGSLSLSPPPININNQQERQQLRRLLSDTFGETRGNEIGSRIPPRPFVDVFDFAMLTELTQAEFEQIETRIMAGNAAANRRGKVNVNQAPREVLAALEGLSPADADALLARRPTAVASKPGSIAWVLDVLKERAIGLGNQITGRGGQYSADIVAVSGDGRAFRRVRIVVDASDSARGPWIVYRRDQTDLGWPLDRSILESQRGGGSIRDGSVLPSRREGMSGT